MEGRNKENLALLARCQRSKLHFFFLNEKMVRKKVSDTRNHIPATWPDPNWPQLSPVTFLIHACRLFNERVSKQKIVEKKKKSTNLAVICSFMCVCFRSSQSCFLLRTKSLAGHFKTILDFFSFKIIQIIQGCNIFF